MYQYSDFDRQFVRLRAAQCRDQLTRWQAGTLGDDEFKPLRLQNGWYVQRFAPMLRVAVPYGEISSPQLRVLAKIARDFDHKEEHDVSKANAGLSEVPTLPDRTGHFTTRQNVQYNWIPLSRSADVMDLLASVGMHGIQTSGNCIRNITTDALAGIAVDEVADPRPFAEILRQWSTLHPEFAFLPRKFKVAITGAREDRAATPWHDVGLRLLRNVDGELGFQVRVGVGMGRTPIIGSVIREFLPWNQILNYLEAVVGQSNVIRARGVALSDTLLTVKLYYSAVDSSTFICKNMLIEEPNNYLQLVTIPANGLYSNKNECLVSPYSASSIKMSIQPGNIVVYPYGFIGEEDDGF